MWRLRSLRGRLVAGLLAVVAIGLFGASVGIYAALGNFLQSRTDQQLRNSRLAVLTELKRGADYPGQLTVASGRSVIPDGTYGEYRDPAGQPLQFYKRADQVVPDLSDRTYEKESYSTVPAQRRAHRLPGDGHPAERRQPAHRGAPAGREPPDAPAPGRPSSWPWARRCWPGWR